ncbi:MAG: LLM class flavin-dependent oxidoreductase [Chloroflexota bacterium]
MDRAKFGLLLPSGRGATPASIVKAAVEAEEAGFESVWVIEDYDSWEAFATLGFVAARTSRIRLGIGITTPYLRNPALLGSAAASLDQFADGRLVLGVGRSLPLMLRQVGISSAAPLRMLEETTLALRRLWQGGPVTMDGQFVHIHQVELEVTPVQEPVPILYGCYGPKALALAGRIADGVILSSFFTPAMVRDVRRQLTEAELAAGRRPGETVLSVFMAASVTTDAGAFYQELKHRFLLDLITPGRGETMVAGSRWQPDLSALRELVGLDDLLMRGLEPYRHALSAARVFDAIALLPDELIAERVAAGDGPACRARLEEYVEAGAERIILAVGKPAELAQELSRYQGGRHS